MRYGLQKDEHVEFLLVSISKKLATFIVDPLYRQYNHHTILLKRQKEKVTIKFPLTKKNLFETLHTMQAYVMESTF